MLLSRQKTFQSNVKIKFMNICKIMLKNSAFYVIIIISILISYMLNQSKQEVRLLLLSVHCASQVFSAENYSLGLLPHD